MRRAGSASMRVLLTRPLEDAERTAERLAVLGWEAVVAPLFEIVARPARVAQRTYEGVVATSANAFRYTPESSRDLRQSPLWIVGERTAREARRAGWEHVAMVARDASDLAAALSRSPHEGEWLYLAGEPRTSTVEAAMSALGTRVRLAVVYETRRVDELPTLAEDAIRAGSLDAVLHFSPRSAEGFLELVQSKRLEDAARRLLHVAISANAAKTFAGWPRVRVAPRPEESSVLSVLAARDR